VVKARPERDRLDPAVPLGGQLSCRHRDPDPVDMKLISEIDDTAGEWVRLEFNGAVIDLDRWPSPAGHVLDAASRLTGHSIGLCAGGNLFGGYDLMGSLCYMSTPSGEAGFTASVGGGGGAPWGVSGLLGVSVSKTQRGCDFDGASGYLWGSAGEGLYGAGASASYSSSGTWPTTVGWAPGYRVPAPFAFGGGVSRTWTLGW